jgi:hypothetical protein
MVRTKSDKAPRVGSTFRLDEDIKAAMERYFHDVGVPPSEQVRRALRAWLEEKGVLRPQARPRDRHHG